MGIQQIIEDDISREMVKFKDIRSLTPFWYEDKLWIRVPGYMTFCTCIVDGKQDFISPDAICNPDIGK